MDLIGTEGGIPSNRGPFCRCSDERSRPGVISLREFKGSHNGELQAKVLLEVVEEYDLVGKAGYFTMHNHEANNTMLDEIAKSIEGFDPVARRLRCSGHIMNLIVQAFLSRSKAKKIQEDEQEEIDEAYERLCQISVKE